MGGGEVPLRYLLKWRGTSSGQRGGTVTTHDSFFRGPTEAVNAFVSQLNEHLQAQLKLLLEERHLYQKVAIDPAALASEILSRTGQSTRVIVEQEINRLLDWRPLPAAGSGLLIAQRNEPTLAVPTFILPRVRLVCAGPKCGGRQTFKAVWYQDATNEVLKAATHGGSETAPNPGTEQLFFVAYQCQLCQGPPEGFLIRRNGWRFSLDGRSPIEEIQVPGYIPKKEKDLYRDAIIAHFAGKQLAAVFYLRVFIEQFARRQTGLKGRQTGEEIMDAYSKRLPEDKRDMMPSLREWHTKLSIPIHEADEDSAEALFDVAREEIERHFDIRRVFKIPESEPPLGS